MWGGEGEKNETQFGIGDTLLVSDSYPQVIVGIAIIKQQSFALWLSQQILIVK